MFVNASDESVSGSDDEMDAAKTGIASLKDPFSGGRAPDSTGKGKEEDGTSFSDEYSDALDKELKSSSLAKSFARRGEVLSTDESKVRRNFSVQDSTFQALF